jgi:hypothetical protein
MARRCDSESDGLVQKLEGNGLQQHDCDDQICTAMAALVRELPGKPSAWSPDPNPMISPSDVKLSYSSEVGLTNRPLADLFEEQPACVLSPSYCSECGQEGHDPYACNPGCGLCPCDGSCLTPILDETRRVNTQLSFSDLKQEKVEGSEGLAVVRRLKVEDGKATQAD